MQNKAGAWISELPGYIARQAHDPAKIAGGYWREVGQLTAGRAEGIKGKLAAAFDWPAAARMTAARASFGVWRDFITPLLHDKTFEGLDPQDVAGEPNPDLAPAAGVLRDPTDPRELMLHTVWMDIVTGRHAELSGMDDAGDFRLPENRAASVSREQVLHFKTPDAWMDYDEKFGRASLVATVMHQLEQAGRNTALMERWGPSPEAGFAAEQTRLAAAARARGDPAAVKKLDGYMTRARFEQVTGQADTPENMRVAQVITRTIRGAGRR